MMVQSTIDKIKDTTIWRTIRKLAGVVDEQNEKVQEVEDKLDNFDLDGVKSDITALKTNDAKQDTEIATVDKKIDTEISKVDYRLDGHDNQISNLHEEDTKIENAMPKTYTLYRDGTGKIKAQVETIDGTLMNSNTLDMIIPYQYDIVSGTTNRSFKLNITMSDGSNYTTNDFVIPEGGGSDITVTGITLSKDTSDVNRFHVGINLSDGDMIDSGFISMVDNVSGTFADNKLTITVNGVSSVPIEIDASGSSYTAGTGIIISDGTISVDSTVVALKTDIPDVSDMETKTHASQTYPTKDELNQVEEELVATEIKVGSSFSKVESSVLYYNHGQKLTFTDNNNNNNEIPLTVSCYNAIYNSLEISTTTTMWSENIQTYLKNENPSLIIYNNQLVTVFSYSQYSTTSGYYQHTISNSELIKMVNRTVVNRNDSLQLKEGSTKLTYLIYDNTSSVYPLEYGLFYVYISVSDGEIIKVNGGYEKTVVFPKSTAGLTCFIANIETA